jgi:hypothetical protein
MPDELIEKVYREEMNKLASELDRILKPAGFALLVFDFGDHTRVNYISNAKRDDMIGAMKAFIARQDDKSPSA